MMQPIDENNSFNPNYSIQLKGLLMDFSTPKLMGIVNLTPDSFFEGSRFQLEKHLLSQVELMLKEGADIIDLGAFSSRPFVKEITEQLEKERLIAPLKAVLKEFSDAVVSVDTSRSEIAKASVQEGASMINDISGGDFDSKMFETISELKVPYVLMHMQGKPENMQVDPTYVDVFKEVYFSFSKKLKRLNELLVNDVILDPGFGFGKTLEHNYTLLKNLNHFQNLDCPILVGLSRKGMIQKVIHKDATEALNATTAAHVLALMNGANILRVHDVKEAKEAIDIVNCYQKH